MTDDRAMDMRATDADRDAASAIVASAASDGRLTLEEMHERLESTFAARTHGDLVAVTRDLVAGPPNPQPGPYTSSPVPASSFPAAPFPAASFRPPAPYQQFPGISGRGTSIAIFGGLERTGAWSVPGRLQVVAVMGGAQLDLTHAIFERPQTTINVVTIMGGVEIIAPVGIRVQSDVMAIMGGCSNRADDGPADRVVHVTGVAIMGGVDIRRPHSDSGHDGLTGRPPGPVLGPPPEPPRIGQ